MSDPAITVIVATFNAGKTLRRCLDSFRAQDYPAKQLVLMDGGSSDNTCEIAAANKDILSYWESSPDTGIYNAWNKALPHVTGDWIYFLGADDYFSGPKALSSAAALLAGAFPPYRVAYGRVDLVNAEGRVWMTAGEPWDRRGFSQEMCLPHQGVFQHRSLFTEYGNFDESFRIVGDYELLLRDLKDHDAIFFPELKVACMSYGGVSSSPANAKKALREVLRARRKHNIHGFPCALYWAYFKASVRALISGVFGEAAALKAANAYRRLAGRGAV